MGIVASLLGADNPLAQWTLANHGLLSNWGAGIAQGTNFGDALSNAARLGPAGQLIDQQYQKEQTDKADREAKIKQSAIDLAKWPDLVKYVTDTGDTSGAFSEAFKRSAPGYGDPNYGKVIDPVDTYAGRLQVGREQGLTGTDLGTFALTGKLPGGNQTARAGVGQPVYFQNIKDPNVIRAVQPMTTGAGQDMLTGGTLPGDPSDWRVIDPATMAGQKSQQTVDAKTAGAARAALPGAEQSYAVTQRTLQALTSDPSVMAGQKENFGKLAGVIPQQMAPVIPGTNRANFKNIVDQLSGQAFLNIRQALKGAGQVTDYEGQKGEIALSRMKAAADSGDEQAFMQAVADYQTAIDNGMELLRQQAQGGFTAGSPAVTGGGGAGYKVLSVE